MVLPENLQIAELVPQAQLMVRLELIAMVGSADALQILPAVRIPYSQLAD
jgi:hypothetical protein